MTSWVPFDLLDHLWQSTLFTAGVWLVARAVRSNAARVRYWLWFAASMKFLIPLSLLVSFGERFAWRTAVVAPPPAVSSVIEQVLTPAAAVAAAPVAPIAAAPPFAWPVVLLVAWGLGVALVLAEWWRQWRPIKRALRDARPIDLRDDRSLTVLASASMVEPGVFGIWRQVLLVPEGISDRLAPAQLRALIAHERCHVLHHDNLTAALHMVVEALFWFHPLVWWLEGRLIEERERACDEYVLKSGSSPRDYAEGILEVCRFARDPSPVFVAGVTGADLRCRIESILRNETTRPLGIARTVALAACCALAGLGPVAAGAANAVPLITVGQDPSAPVAFEVASVKPNRSGERSARIDDDGPGGRFTAINVPLKRLITYAYQISDNQLVSAPGWIADARFDITARLDHEPPAVQRWEAGERRLALRTLLAGRFNLIVKRETREFPMYALVMARPDGRPGPKLTPSATDCSPEGLKARLAANQAGQPVSGRCGSQFNTGRIRFGGYPMSEFAKVFSYNDRNVIDRTGLTGNWDLDLTFQPDQVPPGQDAPATDPNAASLPAAIQEQLGLKLEPTNGLMEVLVVERVERPTEN